MLCIEKLLYNIMHSVFTNLITNNNKTNKLEYLISFLSSNFLAGIYVVLHISLLL